MHVAVVGGGLSGLTAAYRLRTLLGPDARITVIEVADRFGGKLRTIEVAGRRYDMGAEAFLARRPEAVNLITELGLADELTHPAVGGAGIRAGGQTRPIPARTVLGVPVSADAVADVLSPDGQRQVAAEPTLPPLRLDGTDVSVGALLSERLGPEVRDRLADPLLGGVYAGRADELGLRATMPALAAALDAGADSLLSAAASTMPTPSPNPQPVFGTLRSGLGTLIDVLAKAADVDARFGVPVRSLHRLADGWRLELGAAPNPEYLDADAVILAVPAPAARRLLADIAPVASAAYARIEVASMAVVALALPAEVAIPRTSGVLIASGERHRDGTPFTTKGFTYSARKWAHFGDENVLLIRGSVGRHGETEVLQRDDDELVELIRADLAELTGVIATPLDTNVTRWGGGLPQYAVGHLDAVADIERAVAAIPGLAIAGAALHGVGVPACIATADAAARRIAAIVAG
jgi:oxygen-dependent protoporphyrinogen oxidase